MDQEKSILCWKFPIGLCDVLFTDYAKIQLQIAKLKTKLPTMIVSAGHRIVKLVVKFINKNNNIEEVDCIKGT